MDIYYDPKRRHSPDSKPETNCVSGGCGLNGLPHKYYASNYWSSHEQRSLSNVWMCSECKHFCFGLENGARGKPPSPWDN